jgi:hypothetical protein
MRPGADICAAGRRRRHAACLSVVAKHGQPELQWMGICAFCRPAGACVASAVTAGLAAALLAFLSAFNLFRLYGSKSLFSQHGL